MGGSALCAFHDTPRVPGLHETPMHAIFTLCLYVHVPLKQITMAAVPLKHVPLKQITMAAIPLKHVPLKQTTMAAIPLKHVPLKQITMAARAARQQFVPVGWHQHIKGDIVMSCVIAPCVTIFLPHAQTQQIIDLWLQSLHSILFT